MLLTNKISLILPFLSYSVMFQGLYLCELKILMFRATKLSYPFYSIRKSKCPLTMFIPILPFHNILSTIKVSICSLTIYSPIFPFPDIFSTIRVSVCSLTLFLSILEFPYILSSVRVGVFSLTIWFPICFISPSYLGWTFTFPKVFHTSPVEVLY